MLMLFNNRYNVTTTTNFAQAKSILRSGRFDLVVLDSEPNDLIEGICQEIGEQPHFVPTILTYVYTSKYKEREQKIRNLVNAIFYKPFELSEVTDSIESLLRKTTTRQTATS